MNLLSVLDSMSLGCGRDFLCVLLSRLANFLKIVAITAFIMIPMPLIIIEMLAS